MKAQNVQSVHIVGSGVASLAAAFYFVQAKVPGVVTVYEAEDELGGAMVKTTRPAVADNVSGPPGTPKPPPFGYVLPATRILDREYRCAYDFLSRFPSVSEPDESIEEDVHEFNATSPYHDQARLIDRNGEVVASRHFGVGFVDLFKLGLLAITSESALENKAISDLGFSDQFYHSEFWIAWSTMMGPLPEHSAIEMKRYLLRFLHVVPDVLSMTSVWRMRMNQCDSIVAPIRDWLTAHGVVFARNAFVNDATFVRTGQGTAATSISVNGGVPIRLDPDTDIVLVTLGSQIADMRVGSMDTAPPPAPPHPGRDYALWKTIASKHPDFGFGGPDAFFTARRHDRTMWVTFTVTTTDRAFFDCLETLTGVGLRRNGLITLTQSPWQITIAPLPTPHFANQPADTMAWWGYSVDPERKAGEHVDGKTMPACTGSEILKETILQLGFDKELPRILASSICIPCVLPWCGSVWMTRTGADRPKAVPDGARNFGFIGQFCELPDDTMFTMEYSVRSAREVASRLLELPALAPPPAYCGLTDWRALAGAAKTFLL